MYWSLIASYEQCISKCFIWIQLLLDFLSYFYVILCSSRSPMNEIVDITIKVERNVKNLGKIKDGYVCTSLFTNWSSIAILHHASSDGLNHGHLTHYIHSITPVTNTEKRKTWSFSDRTMCEYRKALVTLNMLGLWSRGGHNFFC